MNKELSRIYREDQADRQTHPLPRDLAQRDRIRRRHVQQLLQAGMVQDPADYFHASMIFHHGQTLDDHWQAHTLAKQAAMSSYPGARWLVAATYDRWLTSQGRPQKYGTQYVYDTDGKQKLRLIDPTTTDAERAEWGVPPLAMLLERYQMQTQPPTTIASLARSDLRIDSTSQDASSLGKQLEVNKGQNDRHHLN